MTEATTLFCMCKSFIATYLSFPTSPYKTDRRSNLRVTLFPSSYFILCHKWLNFHRAQVSCRYILRHQMAAGMRHFDPPFCHAPPPCGSYVNAQPDGPKCDENFHMHGQIRSGPALTISALWPHLLPCHTMQPNIITESTVNSGMQQGFNGPALRGCIALSAVSQRFLDFARNVAHAAREVKYIAQEMNNFSTILRTLRDTLQHATDMVLQALSLCQTCQNLADQAEENVKDFDKFLADLEPLRHSMDANLIAKMVARLRWNFRKTDLLLLRSKLDSSKSSLNLCMTTIHMRFVIEELKAVRQRAEINETEIQDLQNQM